MATGSVKKTYNLPPRLVTQAKRILGAKTETEAIVRSLQDVVREEAIERAVRRSGGRLPGYRPLR